MKITIWVTTDFNGFHCWPEAPESVSFLREIHRHVFKVKVALRVFKENREVEFFTLQKLVNQVISGNLVPLLLNRPSMSCEMMAAHLLDVLSNEHRLLVCEVTVSEDGENGSTVEVDI
jgi:hypothetical protein